MQSESLNLLIRYSSESRLLDISRFIGDARADLRTALPTAQRFFQRSLINRFRHSSLGLLWAFVPSIVTALVLTVGHRTRFVAASPGDVSPAFYGVFGLVLAQTFLEAMQAQRTLFSAHQHLLRRNNVPLEGLILAGLIDTTFGSAIRLLVLTVVFFVFLVPPTLTLPLALLAFLGVQLLGAGIGLLLAPYSALRKDVDNIMAFFPWLLFALTPVFVSARTNPGLAVVHAGNPLAGVFNGIRTLAYGAEGSPVGAYLVLPVALLCLTVSWLLCRLWRPYVVERTLV